MDQNLAEILSKYIVLVDQVIEEGDLRKAAQIVFWTMLNRHRDVVKEVYKLKIKEYQEKITTLSNFLYLVDTEKKNTDRRCLNDIFPPEKEVTNEAHTICLD